VLSVVVPTRMRPQVVVPTLRSIAAQEAPAGGLEVVVVVDGCEAGTADAVRRSCADLPVSVVEQPRGGLAAARNRGAAESRGEHLVFCDDDMVLSPGFLRRVDDELRAGADVALTVVRTGDWVPHTVTTAEVRRWDGEAHEALLADGVVFDHVHFAATGIRRAAFEGAGGFDAGFTAGGAYGNEDIELGHRLLGAGAVVRYARDAVAETDACTDPTELLARMTDVGRNDVRLARAHPELAAALFGRKLAHSDIYRLTGRLVMAAPWAAAADRPLRGAFRLVVRTGRSGPLSHRLWFAVRATRYWTGVAAAGGRDLVARGRDEYRPPTATR
jgi:glycosyltransferase involved in cell wall biosynthesis